MEDVHLFGIQGRVGVKGASSPFLAFIARWLVGTIVSSASPSGPPIWDFVVFSNQVLVLLGLVTFSRLYFLRLECITLLFS
jgi:hypothetical protein